MRNNFKYDIVDGICYYPSYKDRFGYCAILRPVYSMKFIEWYGIKAFDDKESFYKWFETPSPVYGRKPSEMSLERVHDTLSQIYWGTYV